MEPGNPNTVDYRAWYVYESQALAIAVGGQATDQINIESDADFIWIKAAYMADLAGAAQTEATRVIPNVDVQIVDTGSSRNLLNGNIPIPSIFGHEGLPSVLPIPYRLKANSILRIDYTSREAVSTPNVRLAFIGYKDFGPLARR